ncbi:MAG: potassium channel family protein [Atopobiaceae bacterium]|jgi:voltage-gated potassium channel|nr:potassium channel family protein [Atopobiaceae bacterium]
MFRKLRLLRSILYHTGTWKLFLGLVMTTLVFAALIDAVEPGINGYGTALWYCYVSLATIGFGDVVATTLLGRVLTVILSIYGYLVLAVIVGAVVEYSNELLHAQQSDAVGLFLDKLENLPELSPAELAEVSSKIKRMRK